MSAITLKGVVFDLDGVITRTASVHAQAWETAFNEYLKQVAEEKNVPFEPFDRTNDYQNYVDGKPRFEGVLSFMKSRGIRLPPGDPDDPPSLDSICGIGNRKNALYQEILQKEGPEVFQSSVDLIHELKKQGVRVGVATSSRNCQLVLELAGLQDLFETQVDGVFSAQHELKGKPDPDIFVAAARNLGLNPGECVVVEDAISGVQAGCAGNFGLTLGVARNVQGEMLLRFGADLVVSDLGEITVDDLLEWFETGMATDEWFLTYSGFDPGDEKLRETLTTVGNGYLGTRGAYEAEEASFNFYPGTYISGIFNKTASKVHGQDVWNNDFVNCPNWLPVEFKIGNGEFLSPLSMEILSYSHQLNMREGAMERDLVVKDQVGRITRISSYRLASMADPHLCALKFDLTPLNYSAKITFRSSLDGNVENGGVARYSALNTHHLARVSGGKAPDGIFLHMETTHSRYQIVMASKVTLLEDGKALNVRKEVVQERAKVSEEMKVSAKANNRYSLEKFVYIRTSLDKTPGDLKEMCLDSLAKVRTFQGVYGPHVKSWKALWQKADIRVTGDRFVQRVLRLHIYHLLVTASPHNVDRDAGMPARGLSGEAYRGHIFWDELYIQPFFDSNFPDISKALLMYRYNRLDAAREYARENGYIGAMYPWQTADDGTEETQEVHYNPESKQWDPDLSRNQRHVSIAVFVNAWRYVSWTGDKSFLKDYGAEMMLDIARFWGGIAEYDAKTDKYHIEGIMGPDEFHEALPGSDKHGIKDNAYTNIMVVWLLEKALMILKELPPKARKDVVGKIGLGDEEIAKWEDMLTKLNVILTDDGIVSQFEGYMELDELDWEGYRKRFYSIHRMDRILKAEGDSPDHYKVAKQADTLMAWYVLEPEEVARILEQLGYAVENPLDLLKKNYDFYEQRTSHGSTLSKVVHAVIAKYIYSSDICWDWFMEAMHSDIEDTQGGTTIEGIHTGVMAGTLEVIKQDFAGLNMSSTPMKVDPDLPEHWGEMRFSFIWQSIWFDLVIDQDRVNMTAYHKGDKVVPVEIFGKEYQLKPGMTVEARR
ncbi:beta-phosphoglucomutase family hydrolase [Pseudodesulfovibrio piezophilus]|uniref:Beta-phosphoglucomutase family hydrolase n=1 Tax=Pseudodesulfovibrio piezophilus (strain DSM 21447 / JCM 15486 / C1TLV30) TaxID=1322246 RepID=M1WTX1_PSEP2|nr:beta-phosphoglucomutase family hydrolase [Pseudodesulfovibrio piezophilus]CCH49972.1 Beta-phosphoglucomutase family hydrolase [Pseudodesulfovibrio piezophilus C1TLV30]